MIIDFIKQLIYWLLLIYLKDFRFKKLYIYLDKNYANNTMTCLNKYFN